MEKEMHSMNDRSHLKGMIEIKKTTNSTIKLRMHGYDEDARIEYPLAESDNKFLLNRTVGEQRSSMYGLDE